MSKTCILHIKNAARNGIMDKNVIQYTVIINTRVVILIQHVQMKI